MRWKEGRPQLPIAWEIWGVYRSYVSSAKDEAGLFSSVMFRSGCSHVRDQRIRWSMGRKQDCSIGKGEGDWPELRRKSVKNS